MDYILLQGEEAETVKNYIPEDVLDGFKGNASRYALCALDGDKVVGAAVFDAFPAAKVLSIRTLEEYRGTADSELLGNILTMCENLVCEGVYYTIYDEDDPEFWEPILDEAGFTCQERDDLFGIPLIDLEFNATLDKVTVSSNVASLSMASPKAVKAYGNWLATSGAYDKFRMGGFHEELSSVYLNELKKAFRHARVIDRCSVYVRLMGEEE